MATPVIETDLKEYLEGFRREILGSLTDFKRETNQRFDSLQKEVTDLRKEVTEFKQDTKVELIEIKGEIKTVNAKLDGLDKRVSKLENTQNAQLWTLIVTLVGAIISAFVKFGLFPNP